VGLFEVFKKILPNQLEVKSTRNRISLKVSNFKSSRIVAINSGKIAGLNKLVSIRYRISLFQVGVERLKQLEFIEK